MALNWTLGLADRLSGPARAAAASLASLSTAARQSATALNTTREAALRAAGGVQDASGRWRTASSRFLSAGEQAKITGDKLKDAGTKARDAQGGFDAFTGGVGRMVAALGLLQVAQGAIRLVGEGIGFAAEMASFKESALLTFRVLEGTAEGGAALLDRADVFARALGMKTTMAVESFRELRAGGFDQKQTEAITAGLADLKAFNPKAQIDTIATQLTQLMGAGKIREEDMKPIRNAGLDDSIFYQVLREMTGITDQKALMKKLSSQTGISSDIGLSAVLETIRRQTKEDALGQFANERSRTTVGGAVDNLKAMWERLFIYVNTSPLGASIARIANQVAGLLDPSTASGGRFVALLERAATFAGQLVDDLLSGGPISAGIDKAVQFGEAVARIGGPFIMGMIRGLGEGFGVLEAVYNRLAPLLGASTFNWEKVGVAIGYVASAAVLVVGAIAAIVPTAWYVLWSVGQLASGLWDLGGDLVNGLWGGIKAAWGGMLAGFKALVALLPEGVRKVLGIASPSRVMFALGDNTTQGFALGLQARIGDVESASRRLFDPLAGDFGGPVLGPPRGLGRGTTGGAGLGPSITVNVPGGIHVHVHTTGDPAAVDAEAIAAQAASLIATALYDQGIALGALPPREPEGP